MGEAALALKPSAPRLTLVPKTDLREVPRAKVFALRFALEERYKTIQAVVASLVSNKDGRDELSQRIAIKVLQTPPRHFSKAWVRKTARNMLANDFRDKAVRDRWHGWLKDTNGIGAPHKRRGPNWQSKWYPPHPDAEEYAPLACKGARVMHVAAEWGAWARARESREGQNYTIPQFDDPQS